MCSHRRLTCAAAAIVIGLQTFGQTTAALITPTASSPVTVRYVANAGVLVGFGDSDVLIDAAFRDGIPPYATSAPTERARLESAIAPYDGVDAVLVTHWHEDHFSPEAVAAHLSRNTRAVLVSSPEVVERVRSANQGLASERLRAVLPPPGASRIVTIGRLPIRVLRIRHNPARRFPEQHVAFLIGETPAVLHTGDADPKADNFALLRELPRVDVALLPFWFMLGEANRRFVNESIRPNRVLALHLPPGEANAVSRQFAAANVRATLLVKPGAVIH